jgi:hypothetical protein
MLRRGIQGSVNFGGDHSGGVNFGGDNSGGIDLGGRTHGTIESKTNETNQDEELSFQIL